MQPLPVAGPSAASGSEALEIKTSPARTDSSALSSSLYSESNSGDSTEDLSGSTSSSTSNKRVNLVSQTSPNFFPKQMFGIQPRAFCAKWHGQFPWFHYLQEEDSVLCFYCSTAVQREIPITGYTDNTFFETCFNNWQKALHKLKLSGEIFFIMVDETTDISNTEQLFLVLGTFLTFKHSEINSGGFWDAFPAWQGTHTNRGTNCNLHTPNNRSTNLIPVYNYFISRSLLYTTVQNSKPANVRTRL